MLSFTEILKQVKPGKRTPKYVLLAALYVLKAFERPVTTGAVTDLLKVNIAKNDLPTNPSSSLRKYTGEVEAQGTSPETWRLTDTGLATLAKLSNLPLDADSPSQDYKTDVAFICALEHPEHSALVEALGGPDKCPEKVDVSLTHVYRESSINLPSGQSLSTVSTTATSMGLTAAAIATSQLLMVCRPRLVVMVGIAAGTRKGGKQFGDVLVADPSVDYNSGKIVDSGGVREFEPDPYPVGIHKRLRSILNKYHGDPGKLASIRNAWKGTLPPSDNRVHVGPLGAADQVIDDPSRILEIQKDWRKLIGVEMETYAVYRACDEAPEPKPRFVSFKAVCDFAAEKTDSWQAYAAFVAARFSVLFIQTEWQALWSPTASGGKS